MGRAYGANLEQIVRYRGSTPIQLFEALGFRNSPETKSVLGQVVRD